MKTIEVELLRKLFESIGNAKIRPEHLEMFIEKPDAVFDGNKWKERMVGLLPKDSVVVSGIQLAEGRPLYIAQSGGSKRVIWGPSEGLMFHELDQLRFVSGKPLYVVRSDEKDFIVHGIARGASFKRVFSPVLFADGKILYKAEGPDQATFVVHGAKKGKSYHSIYDLRVADGKPLYIAATDMGNEIKRVVVYGEEEGEGFEDISDLQFVHGEPFYAAWRGRERSFFRGTETIAPAIGITKEVQYVNGKPLYVSVSRHDERSVVVFGNVSSVSFDQISCLQFVDGKPLYVGMTSDHGERFSVIWGGREIAEEEDGRVDNLQIADGKPLYTVKYASGDSIVVHGTNRSRPYRCVHDLQSVDGIPVYVGVHTVRKHIMVGVGQDQDESRPYDNIDGLTVDGRNISFAGIKNRKILHVTRSL